MANSRSLPSRRFCQCVEQCGFSGVGITDQCDNRVWHACRPDGVIRACALHPPALCEFWPGVRRSTGGRFRSAFHRDRPENQTRRVGVPNGSSYARAGCADRSNAPARLAGGLRAFALVLQKSPGSALYDPHLCLPDSFKITVAPALRVDDDDIWFAVTTAARSRPLPLPSKVAARASQMRNRPVDHIKTMAAVSPTASSRRRSHHAPKAYRAWNFVQYELQTRKTLHHLSCVLRQEEVRSPSPRLRCPQLDWCQRHHRRNRVFVTSCAWPSRRNRTQKLSNHVILPCSFTPLTRKIVTGALALRTAFRNVSCRFCCFSDMG